MKNVKDFSLRIVEYKITLEEIGNLCKHSSGLGIRGRWEISFSKVFSDEFRIFRRRS